MKVNTIKFNNKNEMQTVEHVNYSYFKIYLVMVDHLLINESKFNTYCYLSTSKVTRQDIFNVIQNVSSIKDPNKIDMVSILGYPNIPSSKLLKAFEDNFNSFKYGINPVFEIDTLGNIFIDDLSEPLAESIVPGWEPFF